WIGLSDAGSPGTFSWVSGDALTYTNWHPGQPHASATDLFVAANWDVANGSGTIPQQLGDWRNFGATSTSFAVTDWPPPRAGRWVATDGQPSVQVAGGPIKDIQGTKLTAYNGDFTLDLPPPRVVASSIQENDVITYSGSLTSNLTYTVTVSEPM